jgi:hypothetical protein
MLLPTIVGVDRVDQLKVLVRQTVNLPKGEFWECGVFNGGTASIIANNVPADREIKLFDSFEGLPKTHAYDNFHKQGEFGNANFEMVYNYFKDYNNVKIKKGFVPDTFFGLEDSIIAFCHLDLDLYEGYKATLEFVWPRLVIGGVILFDDYHAATCLGAKQAVDAFVQLHNLKLENINQAYWITKHE